MYHGLYPWICLLNPSSRGPGEWHPETLCKFACVSLVSVGHSRNPCPGSSAPTPPPNVPLQSGVESERVEGWATQNIPDAPEPK